MFEKNVLINLLYYIILYLCTNASNNQHCYKNQKYFRRYAWALDLKRLSEIIS